MDQPKVGDSELDEAAAKEPSVPSELHLVGGLSAEVYTLGFSFGHMQNLLDSKTLVAMPGEQLHLADTLALVRLDWAAIIDLHTLEYEFALRELARQQDNPPEDNPPEKPKPEHSAQKALRVLEMQTSFLKLCRGSPAAATARVTS